MIITFPIDLSGINTDAMQVISYESILNDAPWQLLDLSSSSDFDMYSDLIQLSKERFDELIIGQIQDFTVIDVLALAFIKNTDWNDSEIAKTVSANWWLSVLRQNNYQALRVSLVLLLQHHNEAELYQKLSNNEALNHLKQAFFLHDTSAWADNNLRLFLHAILEDNYDDFARLAIVNEVTITQLIDYFKLTVNSQFKDGAIKAWLTQYLALSEQQLMRQKAAIYHFLNQKSDIYSAVAQAQAIFSNAYFKEDFSELEEQTHKFIHIHSWLKTWNEDINFQFLLGSKFKNILRCWLGAGNYYQLEKVVRFIARANSEDIDNGRSINRYRFWTNYQRYILDYWLLIPGSTALLYADMSATTNIKLVRNKQHSKYTYFDSIITKNIASVPTVILKFDDYYFIQPLVERAGGKDSADLIMTDNTELLDKILSSKSIELQQFDDIKPCLIHDHMYLWQPDMALCLSEQFNIATSKDFIRSGSKVNDNKRLANIESWYSSSRFKADLGKYAFSYQKRRQRHG